jgi:hypothetical protein
MDSLPLETLSRLKFLGNGNGEPCLSSYATISRAREAAIERSSFSVLIMELDMGTMSTMIQLRKECEE